MHIINLSSSFITRIRSSRLTGEGAWVASGQIGTAIGILMLTRLLTDVYPPNIFGEANLYLGVSTFVYSIFYAPLMWAILRFYPEYSRAGKITEFRSTINYTLLWTAFPLTALLLLSGAIFCAFTKTAFELFVLLVGLLIIEAIRTNETNFLSAARRQRTYSLWSFADACIKPLVALLLGLYLTISAGSILLGYFIGSLFILVLFFLLVRREGGLSENNLLPECNSDILVQIRKYALPLAPLAIIAGVTSLSDRYIIGGILGTDQTGIYVAAYGVIGRPFLMAGIIIEQTVRPKYFEGITAGDFIFCKRLHSIWLITTIFVCTIGVILVSIFNNNIASLFLGGKYQSSAELMPWIALGHALLVVSYVFEIVCYAHKQTRVIFFIRISGMIACIATTIPLIYLWGIRGAAIAVPLFFGVQTVAAIIVAKKVWKSELIK